jgi:hypothetical protein
MEIKKNMYILYNVRDTCKMKWKTAQGIGEMRQEEL